MANYTITTKEIIADIGDNILTEIPNASDRTLTITPNSGYVVDTSYFTLPSQLPSNVAQIALSNTGVGGEPGNTVEVVVTFSSLVLSASNATFTLGITGDAKLYIPPPEGASKTNVDIYLSILDDLTDCAITKVAKSGFSFNNNVLTGSLKAGVRTVVATCTLTANSSKQFIEQPDFTKPDFLDNQGNGAIGTLIKKITRDADSHITKYEIDILYFSSIDSTISNNLKLSIKSSTVDIPTETREITHVAFTGGSLINPDGETKKFVIYGDVGSIFTITTTKASDSSNEFTVTNAEIVASSDGLSTSRRFKVGGVVYDHWQHTFGSTTANESYSFAITAGAATTLNSTSISSPYTLNQYINPVIKFTCGGGGFSFGAQTEIIKTGRPNKSSNQLAYISDLNPTFELDYSFNVGSGTLTLNSNNLYHKQINVKGTVLSNDLDRIYMDATGIEVGDSIYQENKAGSATFVVAGVAGDKSYIDTAENANAVDNGNFKIIKTSWSHKDRFIPTTFGGSNGGTDITITNLRGEQVNSQTVRIKANVSINKFGYVPTALGSSLDLNLNLNGLLTES